MKKNDRKKKPRKKNHVRLGFFEQKKAGFCQPLDALLYLLLALLLEHAGRGRRLARQSQPNVVFIMIRTFAYLKHTMIRVFFNHIECAMTHTFLEQMVLYHRKLHRKYEKISYNPCFFKNLLGQSISLSKKDKNWFIKAVFYRTNLVCMILFLAIYRTPSVS